MANTFTQLYIHLVFSPKNREALIHPSWEDKLYKYISGIIKNNKHKTITINGMPDHIHIFIGLNPNQSVSDLVRLIKTNSSKWINEKKYIRGKFNWQIGYGAFSYSQSQMSEVVEYIKNQKTHHQITNFKTEYLSILKKFDIQYSDDYLFEFLD